MDTSRCGRDDKGLVPEGFYSADICEQFYQADRDCIAMAPVFVACAAPEAQVMLNHEHSDFRWVDFATARDMVTFGEQRRVLRWIEEEFVLRQPCHHLRIAF